MAQIIPPPLSLYIHFPWCIKKCPYCDFNSHTLNHEFDESLYVEKLIADLEQDLPLVWGRPIHSIFMGGGTPSLFSANSIESLLNAVRALLPCKPAMEITMEVNPGTGEYDNFIGYKQAGVSRLSFGIQSLKDENLKCLGRIHTAKQATSVYNKAREAGFNNINLDMMFALPNQSLAEAKADLLKLINLNPEHISYYQLTIEPNTLFAKYIPKNLPNNDNLEAMYIQGNELLSKFGYEQYEVSAYAKNTKYCMHNINYWQFGDYLGIGAGAHSKISLANNNEIKRYVKLKLPKKYMDSKNNFKQEEKTLTVKDLCFEYMLNAVRLKRKISASNFILCTGVEFDFLTGKLKKAQELGLLEVKPDEVKITPKGYLLSDEIVKFLL